MFSFFSYCKITSPNPESVRPLHRPRLKKLPKKSCETRTVGTKLGMIYIYIRCVYIRYAYNPTYRYIYIYIRIYTIIYHIKSLYHVTSLSIGSCLPHNAQPHWCECSHCLLSLSDLLPGCSLSRCRSFSSEEVNVGS